MNSRLVIVRVLEAVYLVHVHGFEGLRSFFVISAERRVFWWHDGQDVGTYFFGKACVPCGFVKGLERAAHDHWSNGKVAFLCQIERAPMEPTNLASRGACAFWEYHH